MWLSLLYLVQIYIIQADSRCLEGLSKQLYYMSSGLDHYQVLDIVLATTRDVVKANNPPWTYTRSTPIYSSIQSTVSICTVRRKINQGNSGPGLYSLQVEQLACMNSCRECGSRSSPSFSAPLQRSVSSGLSMSYLCERNKVVAYGMITKSIDRC